MTDITGQRFSRLLVIAFDRKENNQYYWKCQCDCGNETIINNKHLRRTKSCGCYQREVAIKLATKHGYSKNSKEYKSWSEAKSRCYNPKTTRYERWGGRGIVMCDRWKNDFVAFLNDMGPRPKGTSLEREDNDGNYEPGNCKWATNKEQSRNRRTSHKLTYKGKTKTIAEWAEIVNISYDKLYQRITKIGWTVEEALDDERRTT
jgi:hypothetical protein